jgi:thioredoxin-related protein
MSKYATSILALVAASTLAAQEGTHAKWYADFDEAAAVAEKAGKDLLVDFTGSDWCGWCIRLHQEVFDHDEFQDGVKDHFVLVALDFPRSEEAKAKVPNPERTKELQGKYGVRGFPTILLMTPDGDVFGKSGYKAGGPVPYVEALDKMRTEGKRTVAEINDLVAKFDAAKGPTRDAVIGLAIEKLAAMSGDQVGIDKIAEIVKNAVESPDAAVQEKALFALLKAGQGDEAVLAKAAELDPDNKKGLYEYTVQGAMASVRDDESAKAFLSKLDDLVAKGAKDAALLERLLVQATNWTAGPLKDKDASVKYATLLRQKAKDPAKHAELIETVLGDGQ